MKYSGFKLFFFQMLFDMQIISARMINLIYMKN